LKEGFKVLLSQWRRPEDLLKQLKPLLTQVKGIGGQVRPG
jgi:hypothetical protein